MHNSVEIEIHRKNGILLSVKAIVPVWQKMDEDGMLSASIPFLGIDTYGLDENDLEVGIHEAFIGMCISVEKYGKGLESELLSIGWEITQSLDGVIIMDASHLISKFEVFESLVDTGEQSILNVDLDNYLMAA